MYLGDWTSREDVEESFNMKLGNDAEILLAHYGGGAYDGRAFVLYSENNKLFEVNGSHCSCYGLEDQWDLEETTIAALRHRIEQGELGQDEDYNFADELTAVLGEMEQARED